MAQRIKGFVFILFMALSTFFGCTLFLLPSLFIIFPFSYKGYRSLCDWVARTWYCVSLFCLEFLFRIKIVITGDEIPTPCMSIIIANHRTRLDWIFIWLLLARYNMLEHHKIVLKNDIKMLPGVGWGLQQFCYTFLKRKWEEDEAHIKKAVNYFRGHNYPVHFLLFPEGTDLTPNNIKRSHQYAEQNSLQKYDYVLHPRVKGLHAMYEQFNLENNNPKIEKVYDITVGYVGAIPQNEANILKGNLPTAVYFHVSGFSPKDLPNDQDGLANWCNERWKLKERILGDFYTKQTPFPGKSLHAPNVQQLILFNAMIWLSIVIFGLWLVVTNWMFRWYLVFAIIFYMLASKNGGLDNLEMWYHFVNSK